MKRVTIASLSLIFSLSCLASEGEVGRMLSPDRNYMAVITLDQKYGFYGLWIPIGGDPPTIKSQMTWLTIYKPVKKMFYPDKKVFQTDKEDVGKHQNVGDDTDLEWSPNSDQLAYRSVNTLRIIRPENGLTTNLNVVTGNCSLISSFKWLSNDELLVITKTIDRSVDFAGYPTYHGFLAENTDIRVRKVDVKTGKFVDMYSQNTEPTTFLFHSIMFHMSEISPYSQRIAFSDGKNICVYDCTQKVLVAKTPHHGKLEGIWWVDDKNLILGIGLLSGTKSFSFFSIEKQTLTEATSQLMSHWTSDAGGYSNPNWFRPAITTVKVLEK